MILGRLVAGGLGFAAAAAGLFATAAFVRGGPVTFAGLAMHVLAVAGVAVAARLRRASRTEELLMATMAASLPGVGPLLAFCHQIVGTTAVANAHAASVARPWQPEPPRPEFERELRVVGYAELLRDGTLEQKRNLVRRLASLGEPRYLAVVRRFLEDAEPELRLCAYAELAAVAQRHEARIGEQRRVVDAAATPSAEALARLAAMQIEHARSGALDSEMASYWLLQAERSARAAIGIDSDLIAAQRVFALVLAARGRVDDAWAVAAAWPTTDVSPAVELARAEIAFRRRDRETCTAVATRLAAAGAEVPSWLAGMSRAEVSA